MTIEFPRAFPDGVHVATTQFECREIVRTSPLGNGGRESIHQWPARWRGAWRTQWLAGEKLGAMQAWLSSLRNGGKAFLGRESGRAPQAAHVSGLGGSPAVSAVTDLDEIAVEGLPAGAALKAGDLFSVSQIVSAVNWRALCRIEEDATADGSGDLASLKFSPPLPAGIFTTVAELDFAAPSALMKLTPGSVAEEQFGAQLRYAFAGEQIWGVALPPVTGSMAARESGSDVFTGGGSVVVSGSMVTQESGSDIFAGVGLLVVSGAMAAQESGPDVFTATGSVVVSGSMAAREAGSDSFSAVGIVGNPVIGSMAAQESGSDSFMGVGSVLVSGSMAARESGGDSLTGEGAVTVSGLMAAQESGADVFTGSGVVIDVYTKLLLHCDGSDASTTFADASTFAHTVTASGNAQIDTAQSKFGGGSLLLDGSSDHLSLDSSSDFAFGTGDWTIDFWLRKNSNPASGRVGVIYDPRPTGVNGAYPEIYVDDTGRLYYYAQTNNRITGNILANAVWYHIAVARSGTTTKMFQDGVQVGSDYSDSNNYLVGAGSRPRIGNIAILDEPSWGFNGWLDEIRVSKGIARWTTTFTPPTAAYHV